MQYIFLHLLCIFPFLVFSTKCVWAHTRSIKLLCERFKFLKKFLISFHLYNQICRTCPMRIYIKF